MAQTSVPILKNYTCQQKHAVRETYNVNVYNKFQLIQQVLAPCIEEGERLQSAWMEQRKDYDRICSKYGITKDDMCQYNQLKGASQEFTRLFARPKGKTGEADTRSQKRGKANGAE
tara:strand:- start:139 stop:486 length:348 start_codon:yes stop_codon:yes gene_type:complete